MRSCTERGRGVLRSCTERRRGVLRSCTEMGGCVLKTCKKACETSQEKGGKKEGYRRFTLQEGKGEKGRRLEALYGEATEISQVEDKKKGNVTETC